MALYKKLGEGASGQVYGFKVPQTLHKEEQSLPQKLAIKFVTSTKEYKREFEILTLLSKLNIEGFPKLFDEERLNEHQQSLQSLLNPHCNEKMRCLIMERFGKSLLQVQQLLKVRQFSLKTVAMMGIEILARLRVLHDLGFFHGDIKPQNLLIEKKRGIDSQICLIDFGISSPYLNPDGSHILQDHNQGYKGTIAFSSPKATIYSNNSRRDDLFNLGYLLIFWATGSLPWLKCTSSKFNNQMQGSELLHLVNELKKDIGVKILCQDLPSEFLLFMTYINQLQFESDPDYDYLQSLLMKMMENTGDQLDFLYDWISEEEQENNPYLKYLDTSSDTSFYNKNKLRIDLIQKLTMKKLSLGKKSSKKVALIDDQNDTTFKSAGQQENYEEACFMMVECTDFDFSEDMTEGQSANTNYDNYQVRESHQNNLKAL